MKRLLLLAALGLGSLYLLHLLAQDYMKIRKPAAKLASFLLSKRDLDAVNQVFRFSFVTPFFYTRKKYCLVEHFSFKIKEFNIDWGRILKNDPLRCAQSLICQISAGAEKDNKDVIPIVHLLEYVFNTFKIQKDSKMNVHYL